MIPAAGLALKAAPYVLSALGGIFGKKRKYVDPEELRQKYGPRAIAADATSLANFIINSPYGQELLAGAARSGQDIQTQLASNAAASGLSPDSGASSGVSNFAAAAAPQAQGSLERGVKAGIWQGALPIAAQQNAALMGVHQGNVLAQNEELSPFEKIAAASGQLATSYRNLARKPGEQEK